MTIARIRKFEGLFRIYIVHENNNEYIIHDVWFDEYLSAQKYCNGNEFKIVDEKYNPIRIL